MTGPPESAALVHGDRTLRAGVDEGPTRTAAVLGVVDVGCG